MGSDGPQHRSPRDIILIVDDNPVNLTLTRLVLESQGYDVHEAADAEQAVRILHDLRPDLLLVDMQLPGIDGLTLTRALRSQPETRDLTIVALTGQTLESERRNALEAGCDGYIVKPIDTRVFPSTVGGFLEAARRRKSTTETASPEAESESLFPDLDWRFLAEGVTQSRALMLGLKSGLDPKLIAQLLHRWSGTGSTFGQPKITAAAKRAQSLLREGRTTADPEFLSTLAELSELFEDGSERQRQPLVLDDQLRRVLAGKSVGLIALGEERSRELREMLESAGAQVFDFPSTEESAKAPHLDVAVLRVVDAEAVQQWYRGGGVVFLGIADSWPAISQAAVAWDFVPEPWYADLVLFRCCLVLSGATRARPRAASGPARSPSVVMAGGDATEGELLCHLLRQTDFSCVSAADGAEALEQIGSIHAAVAVLDARLSRAGGVDVLEALQHDPKYAGIQTLLFISSYEHESWAPVIQSGAGDWLPKPFSPPELIARLRKLVNQ